MAKGEFDMLYLCAGGGGAMMFSFDKSTSLEGGVRKKTLRLSMLPKPRLLFSLV